MSDRLDAISLLTKENNRRITKAVATAITELQSQFSEVIGELTARVAELERTKGINYKTVKRIVERDAEGYAKTIEETTEPR
jgi:hypothetical protein